MSKFKPLNDDPIKTTFKRESTAIRFLRKLNKSKAISNELFSKIALTGSRPYQLFSNSNHFEGFKFYFIFNGKFYDQLQVDWVAMGSPLEPFLAKILLSFHETIIGLKIFVLVQTFILAALC